MKPEEENEREDSWRRAFEDAELPPPLGGWERVEPQLPAKPQRWRPAFWWPLAAALLLVSGGLGWWTLTQSGERIQAGQQVQSTQAIPEADKSVSAPVDNQSVEVPGPADASATQANRNPGALQRRADVQENKEQTIASTESTKSATGISRNPAQQVATRPARQVKVAEAPPATPSQTELDQRPGASGTTPKTRLSERLPRNPASESPATANQSLAQKSQPNTTEQVPILPAVPSSQLSVEALEGKDFQPYAFNGRLRVPPFRLPAAPIRRPPVVKPNTGPRFWLEGSGYVTRFNPAVQTNRRVVTAAANHSSFVNYTQLAGAYSNAVKIDPGNAPALSFVSFGIDARGGMRLTRHWYLEGGLQFLRGHSTLTSDVLLVDRSTSGRTSLYTQLLENTARSEVTDVSQLNSQNVVVPARNLFRYSFDYVSVPLSLGYRIRPTQPVNYTISAGLSGDIFLSNRLESTTDAFIAPVRYTPSDGVYRRVGLSGVVTAGMELKLTQQWSLTARGLLRQSLTPGIRGDGAVQMYPHTLGVGLGAQYRFK